MLGVRQDFLKPGLLVTTLVRVGIGLAAYVGEGFTHGFDGENKHRILADAVDGFFHVLLGPDAANRVDQKFDALLLANEAGVVLYAQNAAVIFLAHEEDIGQSLFQLRT